jgi:hypothetical protein
MIAGHMKERIMKNPREFTYDKNKAVLHITKI